MTAPHRAPTAPQPAGVTPKTSVPPRPLSYGGGTLEGTHCPTPHKDECAPTPGDTLNTHPTPPRLTP